MSRSFSMSICQKSDQINYFENYCNSLNDLLKYEIVKKSKENSADALLTGTCLSINICCHS